ncbi:hypothetical protein F511_07636 [Dorcoceras hygrometricum]|uniref:Uncharacterized protein n=1 Tax=Dorcoceras hygrometricum TaxID=472368 RepID=A0A2Z7DBQ8_9LAMI|nr:hypothetical protein F511_07636 [Dorcoceras hygrometricum]
MIKCISDHQRSTLYLAERLVGGPARRSASTRELFQREERLARGVHLGRGRICMLVGHSTSLHKTKMVYLRKPAWGTAQMTYLLDIESRLETSWLRTSQLDELIQEEGTLSSKVMNSHKMRKTLLDRGTRSSEDDEDQLNSN